MSQIFSTYNFETKSDLFGFVKKSLLFLFILNTVPIVDFIDIVSVSLDDVELFEETSFSEVKELEEEKVVLNEHDLIQSKTIVFIDDIQTVKPFLYVEGVHFPPPEFI
jgi:hypothetical protein